MNKDDKEFNTVMFAIIGLILLSLCLLLGCKQEIKDYVKTEEYKVDKRSMILPVSEDDYLEIICHPSNHWLLDERGIIYNHKEDEGWVIYKYDTKTGEQLHTLILVPRNYD